MGEFGEPEDVGWAVRFLASREAGYITGQTLSSTGPGAARIAEAMIDD